MRLNLAILAAVVAATLGLSWGLSLRTPPVPKAARALAEDARGATLPAFSLQTLDGSRIASTDFRGRAILLNFWATWCLPCVKELPLLLEAAHRHGDELTLILLSADEDDAAITRFFKRLDAQSRHRLKLSNVVIARDEGKAISQDIFQTLRLPETILIDREHVMRGKIVGADWDAADLREHLRMIGVP